MVWICQQIQKLQAGREGAQQNQEINLKKNAELRNEIASLKDDLRRERERVDIKAANKKLLRLQKERTEQDKVIANLRKAIDGFGERMMKYESEKAEIQDKSKALELKDKHQQDDKNEEVKRLNRKIRLLENQKKESEDALRELKVTQDRDKGEIQELRERRVEAE